MQIETVWNASDQTSTLMARGGQQATKGDRVEENVRAVKEMPHHCCEGQSIHIPFLISFCAMIIAVFEACT